MQHNDPRPIGVFDSGIGGLTILKELVLALPQERFIYFGDDANCPYGPRPVAEVQSLALDATRWLVEQGVKAVVVACNSASVSARELLRATFPDMPVIVVVPAVKPAAQITRSGKIILAATARAINDRFTHSLIHDFAAGVQVISIACPGLVELVEAGDLDSPVARQVIGTYLGPALAEGADVVVLGCTHFPALRHAVASVAGPDVAVIDSGAAVARQTQHVLKEWGRLSLATLSDEPQVSYYTSGDPERFSSVASIVVGKAVHARHAIARP